MEQKSTDDYLRY